MNKKFFQLLLILFLIFSFIVFWKKQENLSIDKEPFEALAQGICIEGDIRDCGTCGTQECKCYVDPEFPEFIDCEWGSCDETPEPETEDEKSWDEFRCQGSGCGEEYIQKRDCSATRTKSCSCEGGGDWDCTPWSSWDESCESPTTYENCNLDWQLCDNGAGWSKSKPSCDCEGTCLDAPKNPRYYDNPNYPTDPHNPESGENPNNIYLPTNLDWDDVPGWEDGWKEDSVVETCSEDCVKSYVITIEDTAEGSFDKTVTQSQYNPRTDQGSCFLQSDFTHDWKVRACCNSNGTNCGSESNWSFTTNGAPEPISPYDPDWNSEESEEDIDLPVTLKWCRVETLDDKEVLSYSLLPYVIEDSTEVCHPSRQGPEGCLPITIFRPVGDPDIIEFTDDKLSLFTKLSSYGWKVAACKTIAGGECSDWSHSWRFETSSETLDEIEPVSPCDGVTVGLPVMLEWKLPVGANSSHYEFYRGASLIESERTTSVSITFEDLDLDTQYRWRVRPCWDFEGQDCEDAWSTFCSFTTTGRPPNLISPEGADVSIPLNFDWESVPGARSYNYEVYSGLELVFDSTLSGDPAPSQVSIGYDSDLKHPKQETSYSWRVQTCADGGGGLCGPWSAFKNFTTFKLPAPSNPSPEEGGTIFTYDMPKVFSWDPGSEARYFEYVLDYVTRSEEEVIEYPLGQVYTGIVEGSSYQVPSLDGLGGYQWQVRACLDENCEEGGDWSPTWSFSFSQPPPPEEFGLVPCGRLSDDPDTPWNEREQCQLKHLLLLFKNVIDLFLWKASVVAFVLLTIATGAIFYFSGGSPATMAQIISIWKAAGIGYGVVFLGWIIINWLLIILGFEVSVFGQWWNINF
jgi:hypothetical protein